MRMKAVFCPSQILAQSNLQNVLFVFWLSNINFGHYLCAVSSDQACRLWHMKNPKRCIRDALWLCKGPCLEGCLANFPSPASSFTKLSLSFYRLAPATHPNGLQGYLQFLCGCLFYSFPIPIISLHKKSIKKEALYFLLNSCVTKV